MKYLFMLVLAFLSLTLLGQKKLNKIAISFSFSPDYSFRTLKNSGGDGSTDLVMKNRNEIEKAKFGYSTGLNIILIFST